jgi:outer membrane protein assembly factor BamB
MKKHLFILKPLIISYACLLISACGTFWDKDNTPTPTPLVNFTQELKVHELWNTHANSGAGANYLRLVPAINGPSLYTASENGVVVATHKFNGQLVWKKSTGIKITAGTAAAGNLVFVGGSNGEVIALDQAHGNIIWKTNVPTEILATPAATNEIVLVKTVDGRIQALSTHDGHPLWQYQQVEPALILRASSAPIIANSNALIGFANGNLVKLSLQNGGLVWEQNVAPPQGIFAIQRMVDIDANPIVYNQTIYTATYQGKIVSMDLASGRILWSHDISSYTGLTADASNVYVSDAKGDVWAFDAQSGAVLWRQTQLEARNITGPANQGNAIVVGDTEGYLHWLSKTDGHFVARVKTDNAGILATPIVDQGTLYVFTRNGYLGAYNTQG